MIDFNQEHPFENAIGEYLLYNRGKQSKSKWKLDAKQPFEDYKKRFEPNLNKTSTQWAIKCGRQPNGSYIIGIDFDIYGQNQGNVVKHEQTQLLFDDFLEYFGSAGVWESGTEGNYGCCVDISEDEDLCNLLEEWKKPNGKQIQKFEINNVEFLIHTLHLLPPTKSKCKRSKKLRARQCLEENDQLPRKLEVGDKLLAYIRHNVETKIGETTKEVTQQVTQVLETIQQTPEKKNPKDIEKFWDYAYHIDKQFISSHSGWFSFSCAHKNICGANDYAAYDKFCKEYIQVGYNATNNKSSYESIEVDSNSPGWGSIYKWFNESSIEKRHKNYLYEKWRPKHFDAMKFAEVGKMSVEEEKKAQEQFEKECEKINAKKGEKLKSVIKDELNAVFIKEAKRKATHYIKELKAKQKYFEKYHFKLFKPPSYGFENGDTIQLNKYGTFKDMNTNCQIFNPNACMGAGAIVNFPDIWRTFPNMRTYNAVDFLPPPAIAKDPKTLNLFKGFRIHNYIHREELDIQVLLDHIFLLADKNRQVYEYILNYLAHLIQRPGERPNVALLFMNPKEGAGKNLFWEKFGRTILGEEMVYQTQDITRLTNRFNDNISKKLLVILDEVEAKTSFNVVEFIKNFITAEQNTIEEKNIRTRQEQSYRRLILFSNNLTPLKISKHGRRFMATRVAEDMIGDKEYFNRLAEALEDNKLMYCFHEFLYKRDISKFHAAKDRPITDFYKSLTNSSIPLEAKFFEFYHSQYIDILSQGDKKREVSRIGTREFFNHYKKYLQNYCNVADVSLKSFHRKLEEYKTFVKRKKSDGRMKYEIKWSKLMEHLQAQGYLYEYEEEDEEYSSSDEDD